MADMKKVYDDLIIINLYTVRCTGVKIPRPTRLGLYFTVICRPRLQHSEINNHFGVMKIPVTLVIIYPVI